MTSKSIFKKLEGGKYRSDSWVSCLLIMHHGPNFGPLLVRSSSQIVTRILASTPTPASRLLSLSSKVTFTRVKSLRRLSFNASFSAGVSQTSMRDWRQEGSRTFRRIAVIFLKSFIGTLITPHYFFATNQFTAF